MKYLIIDDEAIAHRIIMEYCDMLPNLELQKNCYSALEAIEYLNQHSVDLIFLDINMPRLKGFDFLKTLPNPPLTIVTTAYQEFALEAFDLNVVDYLLKPFSLERFLKAVNKTAEFISKPTTGQNLQDAKGQQSVFLRSNKKYTQVFLDSVWYIEASGNYSKVVTAEATITIREKFSDLFTMLDSIDLLQTHKSFAVVKKHIKNIEGNEIFIGQHVVPIAKSYRNKVVQSLHLSK